MEENNRKKTKSSLKKLTFGTGGIRGVLGEGADKINIYTITKVTQGIANYLISMPKKEKNVAISYDSRKMSDQLSEAVALCLNANGIKTFRFTELHPTPLLSYTVRNLRCDMGIMITASHNSAEYNGYKVYNSDGCQITDKIANKVMKCISEIENNSGIKTMERHIAIERGLYYTIGSEIDNLYIKEIKKLVFSWEALKKFGSKLKVVYTPLNGTGNALVCRILKEIGIENVFVVPEQEEPDGNFPTTVYPNPEDPNAFTLALKLARHVSADLVFATDPDADRFGLYVKGSKEGDYIPFTGNMSGILLADYEINRRKEAGNLMAQKGVIIKTIVSSKMVEELAKNYDINVIDVLTGFKYIGEQVGIIEKKYITSEKFAQKFVFGFEESYGCLLGPYCRDKDAISAIMAMCEAAAFYKERNYTLWDKMHELYEKYGYFKEETISIKIPTEKKKEKLFKKISHMREQPQICLGKYKILKYKDYYTKKIIDYERNKVTRIELPTSNVLYYELEQGAWFCIRPSGTEAKIKIYLGTKGNNENDANIKLNELKLEVINQIKI